MKILFLQDTGALSLSKKERILYFLLLIFFFALYMPGLPWMYNFCMWFIFVYTFFFNSLSEKWALLKTRKEIVIVIAFFLLTCISALFSKNHKAGIALVGIRISILVIPLAIGTIAIRNVLKERLIFAFAVATTCAASLSLVWGIWQAVKNNDSSLLYNDNLSNILNLQSIYFAMLVNLAVFSFIYLLTKNSSLINKNALVPVLLLLFAVHFLLASRIAFIILYSATFIFSITRIIRKKQVLEGVTLLMGLGLFCFLSVKFFPKTINRFKELTYTKFDFHSEGKESHFNTDITADQWNGANTRMAIWQCAWEVIKNNMALGTGEGDRMHVLKEEYAKKGFAFAIQTNKNAHNNYLDVWMGSGLCGLLLFLLGFIILPLLRCIKVHDWYALTIIFCLMLCLLTETYIDRTMGNTLLSFFISFITAYKIPANFLPIDYP